MVSDESIDTASLGNKTSDYIPETYGNVATIALRKGDVDKAESYFNKALGASVVTSASNKEQENVNVEKDQARENRLKKRKEKRQRRRRRAMEKKYGKKDEKQIEKEQDPQRWVPLRMRVQKKKGKK